MPKNGKNTNVTKIINIKDGISSQIHRLDEHYMTKKLVAGLSTGFHTLDQLTGGFYDGQLIILGGRPSMGKTSLACNFALRMAKENNLSVGYIDFHETEYRFFSRLLSISSSTNCFKMLNGYLKSESWPKLTHAAGWLAELKFNLITQNNCDINNLCEIIRSKHKELSVDIFFIDYAQMIRGSNYVNDLHSELTEITRNLKFLALELSIPIVLISALSRSVESRNNRYPLLSDLRDSGSLDDCADLILLIYREEYYCPKEENKGVADISVVKNRMGPTGMIQIAFIKEFMLFAEFIRK